MTDEKGKGVAGHLMEISIEDERWEAPLPFSICLTRIDISLNSASRISVQMREVSFSIVQCVECHNIDPALAMFDASPQTIVYQNPGMLWN